VLRLERRRIPKQANRSFGYGTGTIAYRFRVGDHSLFAAAVTSAGRDSGEGLLRHMTETVTVHARAARASKQVDRREQ